MSEDKQPQPNNVIPLTAAIRKALEGGQMSPRLEPPNAIVSALLPGKKTTYSFDALKKEINDALADYCASITREEEIITGSVQEELLNALRGELQKDINKCNNLADLREKLNDCIFKEVIIIRKKPCGSEIKIATYPMIATVLNAAQIYVDSCADVDKHRERVCEVDFRALKNRPTASSPPRIIAQSTLAYEALQAVQHYLQERIAYVADQQRQEVKAEQPVVSKPSMPDISVAPLNFAAFKEAIEAALAEEITLTKKYAKEDIDEYIETIDAELLRSISSATKTRTLIENLKEASLFLLNGNFDQSQKRLNSRFFDVTIRAGYQTLTGSTVPPSGLDAEIVKQLPRKNLRLAQSLELLQRGFHDALSKRISDFSESLDNHVKKRQQQVNERWAMLVSDSFAAEQRVGKNLKSAEYDILEQEGYALRAALNNLQHLPDEQRLLEDYITSAMFDSICHDASDKSAQLRQQLLEDMASYYVGKETPASEVDAATTQFNPPLSPLRHVATAHKLIAEAYKNIARILPVVLEGEDGSSKTLHDRALGAPANAENPDDYVAQQINIILHDYVRNALPEDAEIPAIPVCALPVIEEAFELACAQFQKANPNVRLSIEDPVSIAQLSPEMRDDLQWRTQKVIGGIPKDHQYFADDISHMMGAVAHIKAFIGLERALGQRPR